MHDYTTELLNAIIGPKYLNIIRPLLLYILRVLIVMFPFFQDTWLFCDSKMRVFMHVSSNIIVQCNILLKWIKSYTLAAPQQNLAGYAISTVFTDQYLKIAVMFDSIPLPVVILLSASYNEVTVAGVGADVDSAVRISGIPVSPICKYMNAVGYSNEHLINFVYWTDTESAYQHIFSAGRRFMIILSFEGTEIVTSCFYKHDLKLLSFVLCFDNQYIVNVKCVNKKILQEIISYLPP
ncbi:uncharacterized protein EV154DRAFT_482180 [Mucor mucedo]|uniref:uncharacterized protein n=1 Tax=Mucor mucedo TaxID=29922 RepID=UPI002220C9E6|nr:uncharacterized protein EV154DRAFT_482180 [Mucor mucedo]KAI7890455.1 hypothetical protein EV154DRAFT_482180 [Mucor mucedo]